MSDPPVLTWRSFPLEQVNQQEEGPSFWEQTVDEARSLRAFLAAEAIRDQGDNLLNAFVFGLLEAVHLEKKRVDQMDTILEVARAVPGVDVDRMVRDMETPEFRQRIAADYELGVNHYGVFGTPTFLFQDGEAVFLKLNRPLGETPTKLFETLQQLSLGMPAIRELKKPRPPER